MTKRVLFLGMVLLCGALLAAPKPGHANDGANPDAAKEMIDSLANEAINILSDKEISLEQRQETFRDILREHFALDFIGRFAMAANWRRLSDAQKEEYRGLFSEYVLQTYSRRLESYSGEEFRIISAHGAAEGDVVVQTKIVPRQGEPLEAGWRIRQMDGKLKIVDVVVGGVSMAVTQRQEFSSVIASRGIEGLFAALRSRVGPNSPKKS